MIESMLCLYSAGTIQSCRPDSAGVMWITSV